MSVHFSSLCTQWLTPQSVYDELDEEFGFTFDPCPRDATFDGLMIPWGERNYVNPPYGRAIGAWLAKAYREHLLGRLSVLLLPARTDTAWWHDYAMRADEIRFVRGRLRFGSHARDGQTTEQQPAPFPSVIVIFRGEP